MKLTEKLFAAALILAVVASGGAAKRIKSTLTGRNMWKWKA